MAADFLRPRPARALQSFPHDERARRRPAVGSDRKRTAVDAPSTWGHVDHELAPLLALLPPNPFGVDGFGVLQAREAAASQPPIELPTDTGIGYRDLGTDPALDRPAMRIIAPDEARTGRPCIFWIHGGGYVVGSPFITDLRLFRWAAEHDCVIIAVQYGLAPERPYPQGLEDCYRGLRWTFHQPRDWESTPTGSHSSVSPQARAWPPARDPRPGPRRSPDLLPAADLPHARRPHHSQSGRPEPPVWTDAANKAGWAAYLEGLPAGVEPPITSAPARATAAELAGLPPCFITVGSLDLFRDEDIHYARTLQDAGVPTEIHVYAGTFHASDHLAPDAAISRRFERDIDTALGHVLIHEHNPSAAAVIPAARMPDPMPVGAGIR